MTAIVLVLVLLPAAISVAVLVAWSVDARARQRAWRTIASARRAGPSRSVPLAGGAGGTCLHCRAAARGAGAGTGTGTGTGGTVVTGRFGVPPHSVP